MRGRSRRSSPMRSCCPTVGGSRQPRRCALGIVNGFTGARLRWRGGTAHDPEHRELETIDGRTLTLPKHVVATELLQLPDGGTRPLSHEHQYNKGTALVIRDATGEVEGSKL